MDMWTAARRRLVTAAAVLVGIAQPAAGELTGLPAGFQSRVMMTEASGPDPNLLPLQLVFLPDNRALFIHIGGKIYIGDPSRPGFPTELYMELPLCCELSIDFIPIPPPPPQMPPPDNEHTLI